MGAAIVLAVAVLAVPVRGAGRNVTFRTEDGVTLAGTWYEPSTRSGPGVILVHMLHRSRHDWDALAARLSGDGIGTLTFDLRGHGESTGAVPAEGDFTAFQHDVAAARRFVAGRPEVAGRGIGLAGASLGAALVALDAAQSSAVSSLALLSASTDYRGLRIDAALKKFGGRTLMVYSDDDPYAQRSARDLNKVQGPSGATRETLTLHQAGHGTNMLTADASLIPALAEWFKKTL